MADEIEGARVSPVKFRDMGDGTVAEVISFGDNSVGIDVAVSGTWTPISGDQGTPNLTNKRVLSLIAQAGPSGGSVTINGELIPLGANQGLDIEFKGVVNEPTIAFNGTTAYFLETVVIV